MEMMDTLHWTRLFWGNWLTGAISPCGPCLSLVSVFNFSLVCLILVLGPGLLATETSLAMQHEPCIWSLQAFLTDMFGSCSLSVWNPANGLVSPFPLWNGSCILRAWTIGKPLNLSCFDVKKWKSEWKCEHDWLCPELPNQKQSWG